MVDIFIPDKTISGRALNSLGHPKNGAILFKYPSGLIVPADTGRPIWESQKFTGLITEPRDGFTTLGVAPGARMIYMSPESIQGNDANDGLTPETPVATAERAAQIQRPNSSDWVLFDARGDFYGTMQPLFDRSGFGPGDESLTYTLYNTHLAPGRRPRLCKDSPHHLSTRSNMRFRGIEFYAYKMDPEHPDFAPAAGHADVLAHAGTQNFLMEDVVFNYTEMIVQRTTGQPKNWAFRKCIWTGAYSSTSSYTDAPRPSNMFVQDVAGDFLLEDSVMDYGGWNPVVENAGSNTKNHNFYCAYEGGLYEGRYLVRRNLVTRGSFCGLMMRGPGMTYDNFCARNGIGTNIGYGTHPLEPGNDAENSHNVVSEAWHMVKGINACSPGAVCTPAVRGFYAPSDEIMPGATAIVIGNIVSKVGPFGNAWQALWPQLQYSGLNLTGASYASGNMLHSFGPLADIGVPEAAQDPGRTLSDYYRALNGIPFDGEDYFDDFMQLTKTRAVNCWDERYAANAVNNFIREGYGVATRPVDWDYEGHEGWWA